MPIRHKTTCFTKASLNFSFLCCAFWGRVITRLERLTFGHRFYACAIPTLMHLGHISVQDCFLSVRGCSLQISTTTFMEHCLCWGFLVWMRRQLKFLWNSKKVKELRFGFRLALIVKCLLIKNWISKGWPSRWWEIYCLKVAKRSVICCVVDLMWKGRLLERLCSRFGRLRIGTTWLSVLLWSAYLNCCWCRSKDVFVVQPWWVGWRAAAFCHLSKSAVLVQVRG